MKELRRTPRKNHDGVPAMGVYFGRYPDPSLAGTHDLEPVIHIEPQEPSADGCPAGWYRNAYTDSVARYTRMRTEAGGRVPNYLHDDPGTPWQVKAAVRHLEQQQERAIQYRAELALKSSERERSKREKAAKNRRR